MTTVRNQLHSPTAAFSVQVSGGAKLAAHRLGRFTKTTRHEVLSPGRAPWSPRLESRLEPMQVVERVVETMQFVTSMVKSMVETMVKTTGYG